MPAPDTLTVLTGMYAAESAYLAAGGPGTASFDALAPLFAPDVVLHQADTLPYGGVWRGHRGLERFFLAMRDIWASFELEGLQDFLTTTGPTAVVHTLIRARSRATGRTPAFPVLQTLATRGGRITEVKPFSWDTAAVTRACTLSPHAPRPARTGTHA